MRSLSVAETQVISSMLATSPKTEEERLVVSGVPRSTFKAVRKKVIAHGWLRERWMPDPVHIGVNLIDFVVAQPFADRRSKVLQAARQDPSVVELWSSAETIFAVCFRTGSHPVGPSLTDTVQASKGRSWIVQVDPTRETVPIYFDYEGAWSRLCRRDGLWGYPQSLGGNSRDHTGRTGKQSIAENSKELLDLLSTSGLEDPLGKSKPILARWKAARGRARLVRLGSVTRRLIPDFQRIPDFQGLRFERLALITGKRRPDADVRHALSRLIFEARAAPFLFAVDSKRILIGTHSPAPPSVQIGRISVLGLIEQYLSEIQVIRESISSIVTWVDHEYGRILGPHQTGRAAVRPPTVE
jgi:hypothetical protein